MGRGERGYLMTAQKHFSCPPPLFALWTNIQVGKREEDPLACSFSPMLVFLLSGERDSPCFKEGFTRRERGGGVKNWKLWRKKSWRFHFLLTQVWGWGCSSVKWLLLGYLGFFKKALCPCQEDPGEKREFFSAILCAIWFSGKWGSFWLFRINQGGFFLVFLGSVCLWRYLRGQKNGKV